MHDDYQPGSCGRISPYYDVAILDDDDNEVPVGTTGEICVRPRRPYLVGSGYIGMPERMVESWRNLWLHSGDRGHVDENGWFFFDDRKSDPSDGAENISSFEVETWSFITRPCRRPWQSPHRPLSVRTRCGCLFGYARARR